MLSSPLAAGLSVPFAVGSDGVEEASASLSTMESRTAIAALALAGLAACSLAGGGPTPTRPGADEASATASPAAAAGTAGARAARRVDPRRDGLQIGFGEFAITLEAGEIRPGPVTLVIRNGGRLVHGFELKIEDRGDNSGPGSSDEDGLEIETRRFAPGETLRISADLPPGVYEVECFVAEHDDMGMRATLVVRSDAPLVRADEGGVGADGIQVAGFAFTPTQVEVAAGTRVEWTNTDPTPHTVTARDGSFDSGTLDPGARFATAFEQPGTFAYVCRIHPAMRGTVRVTA
jgi:plastocyanin